ncbi:hypothetical protein QE152_g38964 [Popillia japonica]|uniref:Uncharacterized protein n=1 Tax=Popillia japonica TaxID=7064 RepID=A0AAW1HVL9_POPJA
MYRSNHSMETMRRTISRKGECMKNLMAEVAALLEVEIGEEFDIEGIGLSFPIINPFKITENGLIGHKGGEISCSLYRLLTGEWTIIKKPWKPEEDDKYYYVNPDGYTESSRFFHAFDYSMLHSGNCFRTEQEAEANREAIMEKFGWE